MLHYLIIVHLNYSKLNQKEFALSVRQNGPRGAPVHEPPMYEHALRFTNTYLNSE